MVPVCPFVSCIPVRRLAISIVVGDAAGGVAAGILPEDAASVFDNDAAVPARDGSVKKETAQSHASSAAETSVDSAYDDIARCASVGEADNSCLVAALHDARIKGEEQRLKVRRTLSLSIRTPEARFGVGRGNASFRS